MNFILHHYPLSPYSEKIRAMFGYAGLDWHSCLTVEAPPRGQLDVLSGGYGRIPIAQLGADIFCDSNLIADEIAALKAEVGLSDCALSAAVSEKRRWLETRLFFACVNRAFTPRLLWRIAKEKGPLNLAKFLKDRVQMGMKATVSTGSPKSAPKYIQQGLEDVTDWLGNKPFIGGDAPGIIDFSAYHCFWFLREVGEMKDLDKFQTVLSWYLRMLAFSIPANSEWSIEQAIQTANAASPRVLDRGYFKDHRIGSDIVIAPSDYRQVPVTGKLAGVGEDRWIVARETSEAGLLHLHFPTHAVNVTLRLA